MSWFPHGFIAQLRAMPRGGITFLRLDGIRYAVTHADDLEDLLVRAGLRSVPTKEARA